MELAILQISNTRLALDAVGKRMPRHERETHMLIMTLGLSTSPPPRVEGVDPRAS